MNELEEVITYNVSSWPIRDADQIEPVFIVGMNGSGTTMLLDCLGRHPGLYGFPRETRTLPDIINSRWGDLENDDNFTRLWEAVRSIIWFAAINGDKKPPRPDNYLSYARTLAAVIDAHYAYFANRHAKTRWLEKTPQHAQHLSELSQVFPKAKFIHMIRDGRDCAASFERRWGRTPELTIHRWKRVVELCRADGEALGPERYMEIQYESLTQEPEPWMHKVCEFLDVEFDEAVMVSEMPQSKNEGQAGTIEARAPRWKKAFNSQQLDRLHAIAGSLLNQLGYEGVTNTGNSAPPRWQLKYWRATDYARQYRTEITTKLQGKNRKSWRTIARLPLTAAAQSRQQRF